MGKGIGPRLATGASALVLVASIVSGCGGDNASSAGGSASPEEERVRVYLLLPSLEDESYIREKAGMEAQADKEENAEVTIDAGTSRAAADSLVSKLESAITQQYDAIAVNGGAVSAELVPVLERAVERGIPVMAYDQDLPGLEGLSTYVVWDAEQAGSLLGGYWREELPEGGQIGVIRCFAGNPLLDAIVEGFEAEVQDTKIEIVSRIDAKCDIAKSRAAAENIRTAHPQIKGIFGDTDLGLEGALQAFKQSLDEDLILTGNSAATFILEGMEKGGLADATTVYPFEEFGERAVSEAIKLARGGKPSPEIVIEPELVTRENAGEVLSDIKSYPQGE